MSPLELLKIYDIFKSERIQIDGIVPHKMGCIDWYAVVFNYSSVSHNQYQNVLKL